MSPSRAFVLVTAAFAVAATSTGCGAANVLAVSTVPGRSHWNFMSAVLKALTDRGHSVVAFTSFPSVAAKTAPGPGQNYTEVDTSSVLRRHTGERASTVLADYSRLSYIVPSLARLSRQFCDALYDMDEIRELARAADGTAAGRFDLLVTEPLGSECVSHLAAAAGGLPMVYVVPTPMITYMQPSIVGHSSNPAYVPHLLYGSAVRAFRHRLANTAVYAYGRLARWYAERTSGRRAYDAAEPAKPSVVFVNSHHVTEPSALLPANVQHVGGIHLDEPRALPPNIQEFLDNAPHGVIYFTFGSVIAMSTLPEHIQNAFKNVFHQIPQRVLWKFEGEMEDKPDNVMTGNWFPQRDVLMHPNVKLFISHGGISGVYETVDAGVPVLGFPLYYDQPRNLQSLVDAGMAITMDLMSVTEKQFLNAIQELLGNSKYTKNAKITANRFKDRPMTPQQSVVYWTEYILRHNGAHHLKSEALNLTWYQYMLLDVISFVVVSFLVVVYLMYKVTKILLFMYCNLL